jgi:hypothetical protein
MTNNLLESSLSRIWNKTENHACGMITAYRGNRTRSENQKKNRELLAWLLKKGYSVTKVAGQYIENMGMEDEQEVGEPSFFVCNHRVDGDDGGQLQADLKKAGEYFEQDSVLIIPVGGKGAYLVGTTRRPNDFLPYGQHMSVGSRKFGDASGPFFSRIRGRKFAFEEASLPEHRVAKWAIHQLAEKVDAGINVIR